MSPGEVAIVLISGNWISVTVVRYLVRVFILEKAILYVGIREALVLPIWVVSDLVWTTGDLVRMKERKGKERKGKEREVLRKYYDLREYEDDIRGRA